VNYDNNEKKQESVYSTRIRAGKRRTYFFDVRATRANDYFLTITESRKRFDDNGYDRHKVFLYKEDFNKFLKALTEALGGWDDNPNELRKILVRAGAIRINKNDKGDVEECWYLLKRESERIKKIRSKHNVL